MIPQLPEGVVVKFSHGRKVDGEWGTWYPTTGREGILKSYKDTGKTPSPRGGHTVAWLIFPDGTEVHAAAECSDRDNYVKRIGRDIALGRALKLAKAKYPELFDDREVPLKSPL